MGTPAPVFWWDFSEDGFSIIVQSDRAGGECLAIFTKLSESEDMTQQIEQAEQLIEEFYSGRKTPNWRK